MPTPAVDTALRILQEAYPDLLMVYIFGSVAQGTDTPDSDLDFAILLPEKADPVQLWEYAQAIAQAVHRDVDLVDLLEASTVFRHQIVQEGRRIYCSAPVLCDHWEDMVFAMYFRFNEERRELLEAFRDRQWG